MPRVDSISPGLINPIAPTFLAAGTAAHGTGTVTPTLPAGHALNDILLLFVQSGNQSCTAAGYTQIGPAPGSGVAAAAAANKLTVFWKRDGGAESDPTVSDSGDHTIAQLIAIRGCITTGDPFQFLSSGVKTTASTTLTATGGITGIDNMLVLVFAAQSVDSASAQFSGWTNSSLVSITEASDDSTTDGQGGGIASAYGVKLVAGSVGSTTATEANSTVDAFSTIAMVPANVVALNSSPSTVWVFEYLNISGTDIAVIPTNAVEVDIITIAGGAAGGSGIASTAAGGGGGGGGAFQRKIYKASELISPLQITVGAGGIGGATKSGGTASTVKNNNGANVLCTGRAGNIGTDATSNSGGNGGAGGSAGLLAAVGASGQGTGGAGGGTATGATTGAVGSKGDQGGGSGGGGKNAAGSGVGGTSEFGGGGGGGGGSATNGAAGGVGGGGQAGGSNVGGSATANTYLTVGGSGGGGSGTASGGNGAVPGGGGGGGGPVANSGGNGADGAVVITFYF